jgi:hypothetical protein
LGTSIKADKFVLLSNEALDILSPDSKAPATQFEFLKATCLDDAPEGAPAHTK